MTFEFAKKKFVFELECVLKWTSTSSILYAKIEPHFRNTFELKTFELKNLFFELERDLEVTSHLRSASAST